MLSYEGLFFDDDTIKLIKSLETKTLETINDEIHCTFKYHPNDNEIFNELVGKTYEIYLVGYGNDGQNSGFEIQIPDELKRYYLNDDCNKLKSPHITASLAINAKANNTKNLKFKKLKNPVKIIGKFGFWIKEEDKEYLSFKPYNIN